MTITLLINQFTMPKVSGKRPSRRYRPYAKKRMRKSNYAISGVSGRITKLNPGRGIFGFPDELVTTLRYADVITLTSTVGAVATNAFRMNSLFDPDSTGTGHQPYYFDQLAALYNSYTVIKSNLKVQFSLIANAIATAQPSGPCIVGIATDDDATLVATASTLLEIPGSKSTFLNNALGGNNVKTLQVDYLPERDLGLSNEDDTTGAAVGSNPSQVWYGVPYITETGLASPTSVNIKVDMTFLVRFRKLKNPAGS
ncbi:MAG: putative capsid protein [Circoviridae sp.]|nr:MAG: putative capsid protein [Circoviridae sp.]